MGVVSWLKLAQYNPSQIVVDVSTNREDASSAIEKLFSIIQSNPARSTEICSLLESAKASMPVGIDALDAIQRQLCQQPQQPQQEQEMPEIDQNQFETELEPAAV
jgi:hypothetical protein